MGKAKGDVLQGTHDLLVLKTLEAGPMHGYGIASRIEQLSEELLCVEEGSLYPALHRIEQTGWIRAQGKRTENGRPAKFYIRSPTMSQARKLWRRITMRAPGEARNPSVRVMLASGSPRGKSASLSKKWRMRSRVL